MAAAAASSSSSSSATAAQVAAWKARIGPVDSTPTGCLVSVGDNLQRRYSVNGYILLPRDLMYLIVHRITASQFADLDKEVTPCSLGNDNCVNIADGHCVLRDRAKVTKRKQYVIASTKRTVVESETAHWNEATFIKARDYILNRTTQESSGAGCWPWKMAVDKLAGTGHPVTFHGFRFAPQRLSFLAFKGNDYPDARNKLLRVGHTCSTHSCCNPAHLVNSAGPDNPAIHGYADTYTKRLKVNKDAAMLMFMSASIHENAPAAAAASSSSSSS